MHRCHFMIGTLTVVRNKKSRIDFTNVVVYSSKYMEIAVLTLNLHIG